MHISKSVLLLAVLVGCASGGTDRSTKLTLAGSSTVQPIVEVAGQAFEKTHPGVIVDVQGGGSSVGISSARSGLADIGTVSRELKPDEADLTPTTIAFDGIGVIVHKTNPLSALTRAQVVDIYTGAKADWRDVGGSTGAITVINKEEGRSTLELFENFFGLKGRFAKNAIIIGPNGQAIASAAANPNAIAYVSIGSAEVAIAQGTPIKLLALDEVSASAQSVKDGSFPLRRPLNVVTKGPPNGAAKEFIDFLLSAAGQQVVAQQDFVPVTIR